MHPYGMRGSWQQTVYTVSEEECRLLHSVLVEALIVMAQGVTLPGGESIASRLGGRGVVFGRFAHEILEEADVVVTS